jgi:NAD(P)H dehydrogenase (quinone)
MITAPRKRSMRKRVLVVHVHPEPASLNGALKDAAVRALHALGHEVIVSDLYAMGFKAVADAQDFAQRVDPERLYYASESEHALDTGTQRADVAEEQRKLLWADAVILQFPLWWFGPPAMLKGWIDRVFVRGFAYGVRAPGESIATLRYGEGLLLGRRAMVSVTTGAPHAHFGARGISGALDDLLFPLQHGVLFYTGMSVLPPFAVHAANHLGPGDWPAIEAAYGQRLASLFTDAPIRYRMQNGGHYDERQVLRPGLGAGETGPRVHIVQHGDPPERAPRALPTTRRPAG